MTRAPDTRKGAPRGTPIALATVVGVFITVAGLGVSSARLAERSRVESERLEAYAAAARSASALSGTLSSMRAAAERVAHDPGVRPDVARLALTPIELGDGTVPSGDALLDRRLMDAISVNVVVAPVELPGLERSVIVAARAPGAVTRWGAVALPVPDLVEAALLDSLESGGYAYRLEVDHGQGEFQRELLVSRVTGPRAPVTLPIATPSGPWSLAVSPLEGWGAPLAWWPSALTAVLAAFITALFTHNLLRQPRYVAYRLEQRLEIARKANEELLAEIDRRDEVERRLSFRADHDELTGLPTRQHLLQRLDRALARARTVDSYGVSLLCLGIDRFKYINESLGRDAGDEILRAVAERLDRTLRPGDTLGRVGGDLFASVLYDVSDDEVTQSVAARVREAFSEALPVAGQELFLTVSVGMASSRDGYDRSGDLLRRAETAMFVAKSEGRGLASVYDPSIQDRAADVVHMEADIRRAIREDEFELVFQPIISVADRRVAGAEVLLRWPHPLEGPISPGRFIPLAEESNLIVALDRWVIEHAARQTALWREAGAVPDDLYVSVNMSGRHLAEADIVDFVSGILLQHSVPEGRLKMEVTEGVVMSQPQAALRVLKQIREAGIPLLLDDFGTGYSSLSYLHRFPFDILKIDQSFVNRLGTDEQAEAVVRAIVALADTFGMLTVAEGAEEDAHVRSLEAMGVTYIQGYYFSKPLPPEDFLRFVESFSASGVT